MIAAIVTTVAVAVLAGAAGYVGYIYGARSVEYERTLTELYIKAHTGVSAKLTAVKAEIVKLEAEAKAEEKAVVARIKALL